MHFKRFLINSLTLVLLASGTLLGQANCREIKVSVAVVHADQNTSTGSVKIVLQEQELSSFLIYVIGPKSYFKEDVRENELKGLRSGRYTLVLTGRKETDNFCQKHLEFTIN